MKLLLLALLLSISASVSAQNKFGQVSMNFAPTWSAWRGIHKAPFKEYTKQFDFTVGLNASFDWGVLRQLSIGAGFSTHNHILQIEDYTWTDQNTTTTENVTQQIRSSAFNLRGLFHPLAIFEESDEKFDVYFGVQHSIFQLQTSNTSADPNFPEYELSLQQLPVLIGGARYFPTKNIGMHVELSIPGVYTVSAGLSIRIRGRDTFFGK